MTRDRNYAAITLLKAERTPQGTCLYCSKEIKKGQCYVRFDAYAGAGGSVHADCCQQLILKNTETKEPVIYCTCGSKDLEPLCDSEGDEISFHCCNCGKDWLYNPVDGWC